MTAAHRLRTAWQLLCLGCLCAASGAEAARQGSLGATSAGSVGISVSIAPRATISGLHDIAFANADGRVSRQMCLSSNSAAGAYTVAAIGGGVDGAFELANGERTLGYTVEWAARDEAASTHLRAASEAGCTDGRGAAELRIAMDPARLDEAAEAPFTGALTLLVAPE